MLTTKKLLLSILLILSLNTCSAIPTYAQVSTQDATKAILGEASGEPYLGKLAVAEVIRRRGSLRGVYGFKAKHASHETLSSRMDAERAWSESATSNISKGATHWQSASDLKKSRWDSNPKFILTTRIGGHWFFREILR